jgi:hypothetical protein
VIGASFWLHQNCARHPSISGGVVVLLRYLNAWLAERKQGSCTLEEFEIVLADVNLSIVNVAGTLLVPGLGLKEDVKYLMRRSRKAKRK